MLVILSRNESFWHSHASTGTDGQFTLDGNVIRDEAPPYIQPIVNDWVREEYTFRSHSGESQRLYV